MAKIIKPPKCNHLSLFLLGLGFRIVNKIRHVIIGYKSPRPFSTKEIGRSVSYYLRVVKNWEKA